MTIEWGGLNLQSTATAKVVDPGDAPKTVIDSGDAFKVQIKWDIPPGLAPFLGGQFRLRAFAESVGPGPEQQLGATEFKPVTPGLTSYTHEINVPAFTLRGEGEVVGGQPVSGMYRIAAVLQHINGGTTEGSGFSDESLVQIRTP